MKFNPWKVSDPPNKKTTPLQRRRALAKAHRAVRAEHAKPRIDYSRNTAVRDPWAQQFD